VLSRGEFPDDLPCELIENTNRDGSCAALVRHKPSSKVLPAKLDPLILVMDQNDDLEIEAKETTNSSEHVKFALWDRDAFRYGSDRQIPPPADNVIYPPVDPSEKPVEVKMDFIDRDTRRFYVRVHTDAAKADGGFWVRWHSEAPEGRPDLVGSAGGRLVFYPEGNGWFRSAELGLVSDDADFHQTTTTGSYFASGTKKDPDGEQIPVESAFPASADPSTLSNHRLLKAPIGGNVVFKSEHANIKFTTGKSMEDAKWTVFRKGEDTAKPNSRIVEVKIELIPFDSHNQAAKLTEQEKNEVKQALELDKQRLEERLSVAGIDAKVSIRNNYIPAPEGINIHRAKWNETAPDPKPDGWKSEKDRLHEELAKADGDWPVTPRPIIRIGYVYGWVENFDEDDMPNHDPKVKIYRAGEARYRAANWVPDTSLTSVVDRRPFTCVHEAVHMLTGYTKDTAFGLFSLSFGDNKPWISHYHYQHNPKWRRRTDGELNVMCSPSTTLDSAIGSKRLFNDWEPDLLKAPPESYPRWSGHSLPGPDVKTRKESSGQIRYARRSPYIGPK
jgi:hypothetical protein